jgi:hypothetical protein
MAALESRNYPNGVARTSRALLHTLLDGINDLALFSRLAAGTPDTRVLHTRQKQPLGNHEGVRSRGAVPSIALLEQLRLLLRVHRSVKLTLAVELSVAAVICFGTSGQLIEVVGVHLCTELGEFVLVVFGFIFLFVDTGLFIDERVEGTASALAGTSLLDSVSC